ncbi:hypothetical protein INT48_004252 [Thamnidium elegans]|uniref:Protein kinase domain-containing protein n=1 Tax=Thamnidium elegans TaxID=101142 RepID=A0A8H7SNY0_9FUNG|nr:hypothetical protein INT48_004252 [Thamnidium elegans]
MFLSFTSETNSTIYQLHLTNPPQFSATPIVLNNTILHSFAHIQGQNNTQNMAYVATQDQRLTLNLQDLNNITQLTSKPMQEQAVLAATGNILYVIESHFIEQYRFDHLDYCSTPFISNIDNQTTGTVISTNQTQYIALYHALNTQLDIYKHDTLLSNYTKLFMTNGYVNFNPDNATQIATSSELSSTQTGATFSSITATASANSPTVEGSEVRTRKYTTTTSTTATIASSSTSIIEINGESKSDTRASPRLLKRSVTPEETQYSADGSYTVQKTSISSEEGLPVVMAILETSNDVLQNPPYNVLVLAGDSAQGYHFYNYSGSSLTQNISNARGLGGGAIAGIVIGIIAFILLVLGALWYTKKRKGDKHSAQRNYRSMPLSIQPTDVQTPYMTSVNHSQTSSILRETVLVPDEYRDSSRPDIRPLTYYGTHIKYAELSNNELQALEPDVSGPLYLFSGKYTSAEEEKVSYLRDGYSIRTFDAEDGIKHTIHYFSASNLKTFVRSVNAVLSCTSSKENQYIMKSTQGIVLCKPTPHFNYQYIWITSPMIPEHSLYYLLFERKTWTFVDHHNPDYKIWSIYAVLKSVETLHASKFVHLAIDLKSFYYDDETKATDWRLGNFGYAQPSGQAAEILAPHTAFTSPEIIRNGSGSGETSDIWSLACVIYTIATGGGLLFENDTQVKNLITFNDDMKQHLKIAIRDNIENQVFKSILQDMLQVDPTQRKSIAKVLDDWNLIYNMEE